MLVLLSSLNKTNQLPVSRPPPVPPVGEPHTELRHRPHQCPTEQSKVRSCWNDNDGAHHVRVNDQFDNIPTASRGNEEEQNNGTQSHQHFIVLYKSKENESKIRKQDSTIHYQVTEIMTTTIELIISPDYGDHVSSYCCHTINILINGGRGHMDSFRVSHINYISLDVQFC